MEHKLTPEQEVIIAAYKTNNLLKINAFAGSGKSSTLLAIAETYKDDSFLYLTFNAELAKEARAKFPSNTVAFTTHGFAYNYTKNELNLFTNQPSPMPKVIEIQKRYGLATSEYKLALLGVKTFALFCNSEFVDINDSIIKNLIDNNVELSIYYKTNKYTIRQITRLVMQIWNDIYTKHIPMTHDYYLKYFHIALDRYIPYINYDAILLDESQDQSDINVDIFNRLNGKKILVGDTWQSIYSFKNSINAMEKIKNVDVELSLTNTFRFGNNITDKANFILNEMLGEVQKIKSFTPNKVGDIKTVCYITRTNSGIIELFSKFHNEGKIPKTLRKPEDIFKLPLSILYFAQDKWRNKDKITEKWLLSFKTMEELKDHAEGVGDIELLTAMKIVETYWDQLEIIYDIAKSNRMKKKIDMCITSAHTSKGKQWDSVIIHNDFPDLIGCISNVAKTMEQFKDIVHNSYNGTGSDARKVIDEINLFYVAVTRAIFEVKIGAPNSSYFGMDSVELDELLSTKSTKVTTKRRRKQV